MTSDSLREGHHEVSKHSTTTHPLTSNIPHGFTNCVSSVASKLTQNYINPYEDKVSLFKARKAVLQLNVNWAL